MIKTKLNKKLFLDVKSKNETHCEYIGNVFYSVRNSLCDFMSYDVIWTKD